MLFNITLSSLQDSGKFAVLGTVQVNARGRSDSVALCDMVENLTREIASRVRSGKVDPDTFPPGTVWRFSAVSEPWANVARLYAYGMIERRDTDSAVYACVMRAYRHVPHASDVRASINLPQWARRAECPTDSGISGFRTNAEKRESALASAVRAAREQLAQYIPRFDSLS